MIEVFKHIVARDFDWLISTYGTAIYIVLFIVIFIETGLVAMPFLPGDSLLFTAGLFANPGNVDMNLPIGHLNLSYLLFFLIIAAILGDNCNYWIGRKIGLKVFHFKFRGSPLVKEEYLARTHVFYETHGTKAIIMARFVPFLRTFAPFAAGIGEMNYKKFFLFDVIGGILWISSLTIAGYLLGEVTFIKEHIDMVCVGIIFISILPIIIKFFKSK